jgi:hypothetical protein
MINLASIVDAFRKTSMSEMAIYHSLRLLWQASLVECVAMTAKVAYLTPMLDVADVRRSVDFYGLPLSSPITRATREHLLAGGIEVSEINRPDYTKSGESP